MSGPSSDLLGRHEELKEGLKKSLDSPRLSTKEEEGGLFAQFSSFLGLKSGDEAPEELGNQNDSSPIETYAASAPCSEEKSTDETKKVNF